MCVFVRVYDVGFDVCFVRAVYYARLRRRVWCACFTRGAVAEERRYARDEWLKLYDVPWVDNLIASVLVSLPEAEVGCEMKFCLSS